MHQATSRIAVLSAAVSLGGVVCCQQILGLDEGTLARGGHGGASSTVTASGGAGGSSSGTSSSSSSSSTTTSSSTSGAQSSSTSSSSSSTSSGSSSSSASSGCSGAVVISPANLIDDMEEGSGSIIKQGGRAGSWFTYDDGSDGGVQAPAPGGACLPSLIPDGGRCSSLHAMHTSGSGFPVYGAGLGFDLNHASTTRLPYDVSAYTGLAFWALGPQVIEVQIVEQATAPKSQGGSCTTKCGDHFGVSIDVTAGWQEFVVPFSTLSQQHWGTAATWDPTTVLGVQFAVNPAPTFDFWIDDIGFY